MLKHLTAPVLILIAGSIGLQAQLVETAKPSTGKRKPADSASKSPTTKILDKRLDDFGITPRSLATWKTTGGKPSLVFYDISFRKVEKPAPGSWERPLDPRVFLADGMALNGFQVQGADFLANGKEYRTLALLRLNRNVPQASKDGGRTWIDGEKVGESWVFAFDNETLTISNADESFRPTEFKAWALERAAVTRTESSSRPYFHSAVVSIAYGKNEIQGLMKFPGSTFVVAFRGIRFKDQWVARSMDTKPFNSSIYDHKGQPNSNPGVGPLKADERQYPQIELSVNRLQVGTGGYINYGQEGDSAEQLRSAIEFDLTRGRPLPEIVAAHKANLTRSLWTKSDEDGSFSREAEQAYVQAGIPVWFYAPRRETGFELGGVSSLKPMQERIQRLGGKVDFIPLR